MKYLKNTLKTTGGFVIIYVSLALLMPYSTYLKNRSIENQIEYLVAERESAIELQTIYPEGYMFFNALLVLSIIEHSSKRLVQTEKYISVVDGILDDLISEKASKYFPKHQKLKHGAFYNGWVNFTLKKYLSSELMEYSINKQKLRKAYDSISNEIAQIQKEDIQVLETYPGANWAADNLICAVSLPRKYGDIKQRWIKKLQTDSKANMINHDSRDLGKVRGSSQSLITYLLSEYDMEVAREEYAKFKNTFINTILGMQLVKEDLEDKSFSDIDSGPVLLGYGSVATIVNVKSASRIEKRPKMTEGFLNLLGMPINIMGKKYYLFKQEKMFDVFMLWIQV